MGRKPELGQRPAQDLEARQAPLHAVADRARGRADDQLLDLQRAELGLLAELLEQPAAALDPRRADLEASEVADRRRAEQDLDQLLGLEPIASVRADSARVDEEALDSTAMNPLPQRATTMAQHVKRAEQARLVTRDEALERGRGARSGFVVRRRVEQQLERDQLAAELTLFLQAIARDAEHLGEIGVAGILVEQVIELGDRFGRDHASPAQSRVRTRARRPRPAGARSCESGPFGADRRRPSETRRRGSRGRDGEACARIERAG